MPSQFLRHAQAKDRFLRRVVKDVEADQAGIEITVGIA
jgi:hypothetical protein